MFVGMFGAYLSEAAFRCFTLEMALGLPHKTLDESDKACQGRTLQLIMTRLKKLARYNGIFVNYVCRFTVL